MRKFVAVFVAVAMLTAGMSVFAETQKSDGTAVRPTGIIANSIFVTVLDYTTKKPITGARVYCSSLGTAAEGGNGVYVYGAAPDGTYTITATKTGYNSASGIVRASGGGIKSLTLYLKAK
jgi:hypothetical protein